MRRVARATQFGRQARQFPWEVSKRQMENAYAVDEHSGVRYDRPIAKQALEWERKNFVDVVNLAKSDGACRFWSAKPGLALRRTR